MPLFFPELTAKVCSPRFAGPFAHLAQMGDGASSPMTMEKLALTVNLHAALPTLARVTVRMAVHTSVTRCRW